MRRCRTLYIVAVAKSSERATVLAVEEESPKPRRVQSDSKTLISASSFLRSAVFVSLICYVVADALTLQWQSYVFQTYDIPPLVEMMWGVNTTYSVVFTGIIVATSGQGVTAAQFAARHPFFFKHIFACYVFQQL